MSSGRDAPRCLGEHDERECRGCLWERECRHEAWLREEPRATREKPSACG